MQQPSFPLQFECTDLAETSRFAHLFAKYLQVGDAILWSGALGSGKTTMISMISTALGVTENTSSPTYVISNQYAGRECDIFHIDAYRLRGVEDFWALGVDEFFDNSIVFIEWGERLDDAFRDFLSIQINTSFNETRHLEITPHGQDWAMRAVRLYKAWQREFSK